MVQELCSSGMLCSAD